MILFQLSLPLHSSGREFELTSTLYLGKASIDADAARGVLLLSRNASGQYYEIMVSGIDYTPEPNFFDVAVLRLYYNGTAEVKKVDEFNKRVDDGFSPSTSLLPGWRVGLNWTAIVAADNRPYGEEPLNFINIYGVSWDGKVIHVKKLVESEFSKPIIAVELYPGFKPKEALVFYRQVESFKEPNRWTSTFGVAVYDLSNGKLINNVEIPLKLRRYDKTFYITLIGEEDEIKVSRYSIAFMPCYGENIGQGILVVSYLSGETITVKTYRIDLESKNIELVGTTEINGYDLFLSYTSGSEKYDSYYYGLALINTSYGKIDVLVYKCSTSKGLERVFESSISRDFYRAYLVVYDGIPLMVFQDDSTIYLNDLRQHEFKVFSLADRFYARLTSYNGEYIAVIGRPGSETLLHFVLLNPPNITKTTTTSPTTTSPTASTTTKNTSTQTTTTTTTTQMETTTTSPTSTTPTATATTSTMKPSLVLSEGDWLKYKLRMHGRGPLGEMNIEADVKIYVEEIGKDYIRLRIEPQTTLSQEERSMVMLASMTGNNVFMAIAGGESMTIEYQLPLGKPDSTCPIIVGELENKTISGEGEALGHKYSVECKYTSKGVLQEMKFKDTYSAGGQTLETEATLTLIEASKDVGLTQEAGGGLGGFGFMNPIVIAGIVGAIVVIAVVAIVLKKK